MAQLNDLLVLGNSNLLGTVTSFGTIRAVKFDGSYINLAGSNPYLSFSNSAGTTVGYLQFVDTSGTDYFALGATAAQSLQVDTSGNVSIPASTNLTPRTTNATTPSGSLGTSSQTWNTGYIKNLHIYGSASATMTAASTNPQIIFSENGTQPVHLIYTDYDTYRTPAGLKIIGGSNATPAWFEVEGDIYAGNKFIQTETETESSTTHTISADCYSIDFNSTTTGGWSRAIKWLNSGSVKGQFGGFGSGATMKYLYYGTDWENTNFRVYSNTGKIAIRNTTSKPAAGVDLPVLNVQYQNTGSGTYYDTDIISVVGVGETSTTVNNAFVRMGSTTGNLALTAGESAKTFIAKKADSASSYYDSGWINTESMYMITDGQIRMYVNCNNTDGSGTNIANFTSTSIKFGGSSTWANITSANTTFYHSISVQGASGNWNEKQIGVYYGSSANAKQFYLWGNTSTNTRGIYDGILGYVISTDSNLAYLHGTVVAKSQYSYGTEAQRKAISSPKTGQVFFQLL